MDDCIKDSECLLTLVDYNNVKEAQNDTEDGENGTEKQHNSDFGGGGGGGSGGGTGGGGGGSGSGSGSDENGGLLEKIISHLPVPISILSEISAKQTAKETSDQDDESNEPEASKVAEAERIPSLSVTPPDQGPDPEEATILISIIHD